MIRQKQSNASYTVRWLRMNQFSLLFKSFNFKFIMYGQNLRTYTYVAKVAMIDVVLCTL